MGTPVDLDTVTALARTLGFGVDGRFQLNTPSGDTGVWTISRDSMSNDTARPDLRTGRSMSTATPAGFWPTCALPTTPSRGKAMAVGIALHEGDMGVWNIALNTLFCLSVIFLAVSGVAMWWKRRPAGSVRLSAPPAPRDLPLWKGAVAIGLVVAVAFPLAGAAILLALLLDTLVLSRLPAVKRLVS